MEFKKCLRCGCFFISDNDVCCNCEDKDKLDIIRITDVLGEDINFDSIQSLSIASGVNINNLTRLISNNKISNLNMKL